MTDPMHHVIVRESIPQEVSNLRAETDPHFFGTKDCSMILNRAGFAGGSNS